MSNATKIFFEYPWKNLSPREEASSSSGRIVSVSDPLVLIEDPDREWTEIQALRLSPNMGLGFGCMETVWLHAPSLRSAVAGSDGPRPTRYKCRHSHRVENLPWNPPHVTVLGDFDRDAKLSHPERTTGTLFTDKADLLAWDGGKVEVVLEAFHAFDRCMQDLGPSGDPEQYLREERVAALLQGDWEIDGGPVYLLVDPDDGYFLSDMRVRDLHLPFDRSNLWKHLYFARPDLPLTGFPNPSAVLRHLRENRYQPWYVFPYWGKAVDEFGHPRARLCLSPTPPIPQGEWLNSIYPGIKDLCPALNNPGEAVFAHSRMVDASTVYLLATDTCSAMLAQLVQATVQSFNSYAPPTSNTAFDWLYRIAGISTRGLGRGATPNYQLHSFFREGGLFGANTWAIQSKL